ncbi:MAG: glycoside hydrolase family 5 protein [Ideonella sp.]|nr:glycoside hydrolase family 5 protein [Ideonella sp.]
MPLRHPRSVHTAVWKFTLAALGAAFWALATAAWATPPRPECAKVSAETCALAARLGRGVNLGDIYDPPQEGDWGQKMRPEFIEVATKHFKTVRLPVRWSNHAALDASATLDEDFARRVEASIDALLARGVVVVVNVHHYNQLHGSALHRGEHKVATEVVEARFLNLWRQLGERFKDKPGTLIFELLNEPHGQLNGEPWNVLLRKALAVVRSSNPNRTVMIGPSAWGHPKDLPRLRMPDDRHVIVGFHTYDPFPFTHQGATWLPAPFPVGQACCDDAQRAQAIAPIEAAYQWSVKSGYPVHLGEFGTLHRAPMEARAAWARIMRDAAEQRGIGWTYWGLVGGFGVWDAPRRQWHEPLRAALLD